MHNGIKQSRKVHIEALEALKNLNVIPAISKALPLLQKRRDKIVITGVGKSVFVGMKFAATLASLGIRSAFLHPVDALHGDSGIVTKGDILVAFSFSGESVEVVRIVRYLSQAFFIPVISVTTPGSSLSQLSKVTIPVTVREEGSPLNLAPMASTTVSLVIADMLAAALIDQSLFGEEQFARFHPGGTIGLKTTTVEKIMSRNKDVPLISEDTFLSIALSIIDKKKKGVVGLTKKGFLAGVITDGDIRRFLTQHDSIFGIKASAVMTKKPKTVDGKKSLYDALKLMEDFKITTLFVLDKKAKPIGLIHMHDIVSRTIA